MRYYLIAGEASGDLHASNLMKALAKEDSQAEFRFVGGDLMKSVGGICVKHYKDIAYMGFIPVILHLRTILRSIHNCKSDILSWSPDVLILVDYPGFNLNIAKYIKKNTQIPVYYYISPKIWAWKEYRINDIRRDIDQMFSILPFEVDFYRKHHYSIHYVGNPCVDAVVEYNHNTDDTFDHFISDNDLSGKPVIALLAGSRKQEIKDNLRIMIAAVKDFPEFEFVVAGSPGIAPDFYTPFMKPGIQIVFGQTYRLLRYSTAALVTSGTATLETALFQVPQVVCYHTAAGKLVSLLRKYMLKVQFISLVNLVAGQEVVVELVADEMTVENIRRNLADILPGGDRRERMLSGYHQVKRMLGNSGASQRAALEMLRILKSAR